MILCNGDGCNKAIGRGYTYCLDCRTADTPNYDPRYDRAQTVNGAKARYVELQDYTESDLESDLERLLTDGPNPDAVPTYEGQEVLQ